ncbi:Mobile element protein [Richelia intracellularis]|nr:Mobile element protein [Richelia intracellularis]
MTKNYPSNLTWEEWELIPELFPEVKPGDRPRTTCIYAVVNAILYVLCQGCTWGHYQEIYHLGLQSMAISEDGAKPVLGFRFMTNYIYQWIRVGASREPSPW